MADDEKTLVSGPLTIDRLVDIVSPAEPHLSPDGTQIAFIQAAGEARQVFTIAVEGGAARRVTAGDKSSESPRWSPDGRRLAYIRDKALIIADADGANATTLTQHAAGNTMPRWSPDGQSIAFYSRRRGWNQIWLVPTGGGTPRRLTQGAADNDDLQWAPDGSRIAYSSIRDADLQNRDIFIVEVASGAERRLTQALHCYDGAPAWSPDGTEIAFLSDEDGWIHVYMMAADGSDRRQVTFGEFEDGWPLLARGYLHWSPDGGRLAFIRNREGCLDLMTVRLKDGQVARLMPIDGFHLPVGWLPDGKGLVALSAAPNSPPDLWRVPLAGEPKRITDSLAGGLRAEDFVLPERVEFTGRDGVPIHGYLYKPRTASRDAPCAAIVHPHGGPTSQAFCTWADPMVQLFVQGGYAVFDPDYRGSSGYGRAFRLANVGAWGVDDARDCVDAAGYLARLDWVDAARIGIWGGSYGGYLVLCCLASMPATFRAGIDLFGDSEIAESYRHGDRAGRLDLLRQMGSPDEQAEAYRRASPVYQAERIEAPLLILHGKDDARVPPLMSERMIEALRIEGKFFEHHFYEDEAHGFRRPASRRDVYQRMLDFFGKYLKGDG